MYLCVCVCFSQQLFACMYCVRVCFLCMHFTCAQCAYACMKNVRVFYTVNVLHICLKHVILYLFIDNIYIYIYILLCADIMDYLHPGQCSESEFRNMWAEFEWENKVGTHAHIAPEKTKKTKQKKQNKKTIQINTQGIVTPKYATHCTYTHTRAQL